MGKIPLTHAMKQEQAPFINQLKRLDTINPGCLKGQQLDAVCVPPKQERN
jgi:hypothetical protein